MPHPRLTPSVLLVIVAAGLGSLFATYWDDAWHTDIGRDDAFIPPHLLLYGSVTVAGLLVAAWGLLVVWRTRSLLAVFRYPALLTAAAGGVLTLGAGAADAFWHEAFGRDAVLWSPPHMLAVFATIALIVGVLAGARPATWLHYGGGALLLGSSLVTVLEFETDVPQFSESLYLPALLVSALFAVAVIRQLVPGRFPVASVIAVYVLVRLVVAAVLLAMGRTAPDLPLAVMGLAAADLPWRRPVTAYAAGAAGVSVTTLAASVLGLASVPVASVLPTAVPVIVVFLLALLADSRRLASMAAVLILGGVALPAMFPDPASAHDPGQGEPVGQVTLVGYSDGRGTVRLTADLPIDCSTSRPCQIVARRAGETLPGSVSVAGRRVSGEVKVAPNGLWFVYLQATHARGAVETWVAIDSGAVERVGERRDLYLPAGLSEGGTLQAVTGAAFYALGLAVLGLAVAQTRRSRATVDL